MNLKRWRDGTAQDTERQQTPEPEWGIMGRWEEVWGTEISSVTDPDREKGETDDGRETTIWYKCKNKARE
jgi:hypothetical protein